MVLPHPDMVLPQRVIDILETLPVRFHFGGVFVHGNYRGGSVGMSYLDRDKVSLPELNGHLADHCEVVPGTLLHWLFPGKELANGLRVLVDDNACQRMSDNTCEGGVAEIYVETPIEQPDDENELKVDEDDEEDSEYLPGDSSASEKDDEANEIMQNFTKFRKNVGAKVGVRVEITGKELVLGEGPTVQVPNADDGNETPYAESSNEDDSFEEVDSEGELQRKKSNYPRFDTKQQVPSFALGMKFGDKKLFKAEIIKYGIAQHRLIKFVKDEGNRVRAQCDWVHCPWFCLLATNTRTSSWQITSFKDVHICPPRRDNRLVNARKISEKYEQIIRANPTWSAASLKAIVREEMFADVSIAQCKRAKYLVLQKILAASKEEYSRVYDYEEELLRSNPGSTVVVKLDSDLEAPTFQRMYICLDGCRKGFIYGCRKVIGLDGCFFKGGTNGELLCALGRDGNNQMYPIAWAVVEKETNDSWDWFCYLLFRDLGLGDGHDWVIISDQQKGILAAVQTWAPNAEHRNCARHIYANWRKKFKNKEWQKLFWRCAKATSRPLFNLAKAKLAQCTPEGAQALMNTDSIHWSRAWFRLGSCCDSVDNNICESFNKWIVDARFLPIISMLEAIRCKVMTRIQENRSKAERWTGNICPNISRKLNAYITESRFCHAISNGMDAFEVRHKDQRFTVNLNDKTCSCRYWQLSGLPCCHAISCIAFKTNRLDEYIAPCYWIDGFNKTYEHCLQPLEGMHSWPSSAKPKPQAPGYVKMPGRPKKSRTREPHEKPKATRVSKVGTMIRCSFCKGTGHNISTCSMKKASAAAASSGNASSQQNVNSPASQLQKKKTPRKRVGVVPNILLAPRDPTSKN